MSASSCDLHVHSKYSKESGRWILRALKAPESFTPPELIYELAKKRGMDFVTITDINTIDGCLSISHHPDTFLSEEVRTFLPGRRAALHILVFNLTPEQHEEMIPLRDSFPALMEYFADQQLSHSLAHPFYFPGTDLTPEEFKMVINNVDLVESLNGVRSRDENISVIPIVRSIREDPDFNGFTGGSDDHCGRFMGLTYTEVRDANNLEEYLDGVRNGKGIPKGEHGSAIRSAYSVYSIAYSFYRDRLTAQKMPTIATLAADRFFRPSITSAEPTVWHKADFLFHQLIKKGKKSGESDFETIFADQLIEIGKDLNLRSGSPELEAEGIDERTFEILNRLSNSLLKHYSSLLIKRISDGRLLDALEAFTALIPVVLLNIPYPLAYLNRKKGREAVETVSAELSPEIFSSLRNPCKRVWFTDTIDDLNGVSRTIQKYSRLAIDTGREMAVIASQSRPLSFPGWVVNFPPLREFPVPDYHSKLLSVPPFLEVLRFVEEEGFGMMYISTPGPVGFAALGISRLLGIPAAGIYHTDYPRHVNHIVQDGKMGEFAGTAAAWFYNSVDTVLVPSRFYMNDLEAMGIPRERMELFPRGTDCDLFSPVWRSDEFVRKYGGNPGSIRLVYAGRVSREKDLDILASAFITAKDSLPSLELYILGDGPYLGELVNELSGMGCYFCGELHGEDLSIAYASGDIFVFPSSTDTFGNSVLEAQASGLPAIVSDRGGPQEIIEPGKTGLVFESHNPESLASVILRIARNEEMMKSMSARARKMAMARTWDKAFDELWNISPSKPSAKNRNGSCK
ncbi:MAG: glycosyltransferase [Candidatus Aegiribacteria sp.]|nr:glycosyltransferase [Candidatus Aegiribacteria sp.]